MKSARRCDSGGRIVSILVYFCLSFVTCYVHKVGVDLEAPLTCVGEVELVVGVGTGDYCERAGNAGLESNVGQLTGRRAGRHQCVAVPVVASFGVHLELAAGHVAFEYEDFGVGRILYQCVSAATVPVACGEAGAYDESAPPTCYKNWRGGRCDSLRSHRCDEY